MNYVIVKGENDTDERGYIRDEKSNTTKHLKGINENMKNFERVIESGTKSMQEDLQRGNIEDEKSDTTKHVKDINENIKMSKE